MIVWITYNFAGLAALIGCFSIVIASIPIYPTVGKLGEALRIRIASVTDKRIQIMNELITGIQV